jgi:hypothetical protein
MQFLHMERSETKKKIGESYLGSDLLLRKIKRPVQNFMG